MTATSEKPYIAVVLKQKKCAEHDADASRGYEPGLYERLDCGCVFEVEIGRYATRNAARLVCVRHVKLPGYRQYGGKNTGHWHIETEADGVIESN